MEIGAAPMRQLLENGRFKEDDFYRLPEDIQERVNQRAMERQFRSAEELNHYVENLLLRS